MLPTRYEEHINFKENLPFFLSSDVERTLGICSSETNWHQNLEIQLCIKGSGFVLLDGEKIDFADGDVVVVNSQVIHYTGTDNYLKYACLIVDSKFCKDAGIDHTALRFDSHFKSDEFSALFKKLISVYSSEDVCRAAILRKLVIEMLIYLRCNKTKEENSDMKSNRSFEMVKTAIKFIRENYAQRITLDRLAKAVLTDKYTLSREFKKITGQTVVSYINSFRCSTALSLISEGQRVNDAARVCGFNNMSFFTKTFKSKFGSLPSEHKK